MKSSIIFFLFFIPPLFSSQKEEEKLFLLKARLEQEQILLEKKKIYIEKLEKQIHHIEITRIEKTIEEWEKRISSYSSLPPSFQKEGASLFLKERKILTDMLQQAPTDTHAHALLDRILRLITSLNRSV